MFALDFLQITYTSDYFPELYELAVELIRRGHAYVDHQVLIHDIIHNMEQQMHATFLFLLWHLIVAFMQCLIDLTSTGSLGVRPLKR